MMRIVLVLVALFSFAVMTAPANATKFTRDQVNAVCQNPKPNAHGHTGCVKACGTNNVCLYDCKGSGKNEDCRGYVALTSGGAGGQDQPEAYLPRTPGVVLVMHVVSFASLQSACGKVEGSIFSKTGDDYACANPVCDKSGGTCMVICVDGKCHALMPGKPDGKLSLLAILQGGDKVSHHYDAPEPTTHGNGGVVPPKPAPPSPPPVG